MGFEQQRNRPRYARFGLAPKTKADYAFLLHDLYHVKPDGIMMIVLPHGVLFRGGEEELFAKNLSKKIISMPLLDFLLIFSLALVFRQRLLC
jgi:type I restriction-modification system DNA methylase subunit